jgi:hypothetical protein
MKVVLPILKRDKFWGNKKKLAGTEEFCKLLHIA